MAPPVTNRATPRSSALGFNGAPSSVAISDQNVKKNVNVSNALPVSAGPKIVTLLVLQNARLGSAAMQPAAAQAGSSRTAGPVGPAAPTSPGKKPLGRCVWRARRVGPEVLYQRSVSTSHPSLPRLSLSQKGSLCGGWFCNLWRFPWRRSPSPRSSRPGFSVSASWSLCVLVSVLSLSRV